jgi:hypothetical protein
MKALRSIIFFGINLVFLGSCLNPPEFDNSPQIAFESISFQKGTVGVRDSLKVTISFKDGDGDLGLASDSTDPPYHQLNFFANDNGQLLPIPGELIPSFAGYRFRNSRKTPKRPSYYVEPPDTRKVGELITLTSEGFSLPPFESPYDCTANDESYLNEKLGPDTIYVYKEFKYVIRDKSKIVDSLERIDNANIYYYAVTDYFYLKTNPAFYNIKVQFFIKNTDNTYTEYDWEKEVCSTFDGRFPILTQKERPLEGVLTYSMSSVGFLTTFGSKTLKLRITVFDRALNSSNTVDTEDFRLDDI